MIGLSPQQIVGVDVFGEKEVSKTAYILWQEAGCPENKSLDFWLLAEKKYKLLQTFENEHKGSIVTNSYFNEFGNLVSIATYYW